MSLERKFHRKLHQARRRGIYDLAEQRTGNVAVDGLRPEELSVVKDVKSFEAQLERFCFG